MADTPRMQALKKLSAQMPVANQRIAQGLQASRDLQLQQAVGRAPATTAIQPAASQLGGAMAAQAGQQQLAMAEQGMQQQGQVAQAGLEEQRRAAEQRLGGQREAGREQELQNAHKFAQISEQAKREIFDQRMQFSKDDMGRTFFNERQLADYAALKARNEEAFKNYAQQADQLHQRKMQMLQAAQDKLEEAMKNKYLLERQGMDNQQLLELAQLEKAAKEEQIRAKKRAANKNAAWTAGGQIVGAVAGGIVGSLAPGAGTAVGASVGAQLGGGLGSAVGSAQS